MKTSSSQKNLISGLKELSANKKVWVKPDIEMISQDTIANGTHHFAQEGVSSAPDWVAYFAS